MSFPDISSYYTEELALNEEVNWLLTMQWKRNSNFILPLLEQYRIATAIEFGCGSGLVAADLPATLDYVGIDRNSWFLERARERNLGKQRFFQNWDVRNWTQEPRDLAMSWSMLKHFSLTEWTTILLKILASGRYAAFNVQLAEVCFDNGTRFHHVFVTQDQVEKVIALGNHEILIEETTSTWTVENRPCSDVTYFTKLKPAPGLHTSDKVE